MALALATTPRGAEATTPPGVPWLCPKCGATLARIRGRTVVTEDGTTLGGVAFVERRCPDCGRRQRRWLVPRRRD